jgi:pimeloyl-ACP methyl ester carboxylesterase
LEQALLLFQKSPQAELHVFDQCAHWVQWDQAERFNNLVAEFLKAENASSL